jgi:hypothetical protein
MGSQPDQDPKRPAITAGRFRSSGALAIGRLGSESRFRLLKAPIGLIFRAFSGKPGILKALGKTVGEATTGIEPV